jgi:ribonuclease HII
MDEQLCLFDVSQFDNQDNSFDYNIIVGADEAGRGPLAGPVCASAVVLPKDFPFELLNDSKKLSEKRRLTVEPLIKEKAIAWAVAWATPKEIDQINILQASLLAMKRAFEKVVVQLNAQNLTPDILLVDGNKTPKVNIKCQAIVKGDAKIPEIMAASILAKNARDKFMIKAAEKWPEYGFEKHKGYPCLLHKKLLRQYGPCPIHRLTFKY